VSVCVYGCVCVVERVRESVCERVCVCLCVCLVCLLCVCVCVCMCVYRVCVWMVVFVVPNASYVSEYILILCVCMIESESASEREDVCVCVYVCVRCACLLCVWECVFVVCVSCVCGRLRVCVFQCSGVCGHGMYKCVFVFRWSVCGCAWDVWCVCVCEYVCVYICVSLLRCHTHTNPVANVIEAPKPKTILKTGPPKQAAIAIPGKPCLATKTSEIISIKFLGLFTVYLVVLCVCVSVYQCVY